LRGQTAAPLATASRCYDPGLGSHRIWC